MRSLIRGGARRPLKGISPPVLTSVPPKRTRRRGSLRRSALALWALFFLLPGLTSCDGATTPRITPYEESLQVMRDAGEPVFRYGMDAQLEELARQIPGLAGVYYEDGRLVITGKDLESLTVGRSLVLSRFDAADDTQMREAEHSFIELAAAAGVLRQQGYPQGMTMLDIDERANAIRIGYDPETEAIADEITVMLTAAGIPEGLYQIEPAQPVEALADLNDGIRPTVGGTAVNNDDCTMWNVSGPNWQRAVATAAHCLPPVGSADTTVWITQNSTRIGVEWLDPPFQDYYSQPANCAIDDCRLSDLALGRYDEDVKATRGHIARPISKSRTRGPIEYSGHLMVTAKYTVPTVGMILNKVGQTTGWTWGDVEQTCTDRYADGGYWVLCSDRVDAGAYHGDSGAPVFRETGGNTVGMYGSLWGGHGSIEFNGYGPYYEQFWMSSFDAIDYEFDIMWPVLFQANIDGPQVLAPYENGTWAALPSGGYAPHEFRWYKNGYLVGTDSTYTGNDWESFELRLEVKDRFGWFDSDQRTVMVDEGPKKY